MAAPEEIQAAHTTFQETVTALSAAQVEYEAAKTPYLEKKQALIDAIAAVDAADDVLEALTTAYEPPPPPAAA